MSIQKIQIGLHDNSQSYIDDEDSSKFIDEENLEETIDFVTKSMEQITSTNPDFAKQTDGLNQLFKDYTNSIKRGTCYNIYENVIRSFPNLKSIDLKLEGLLLSAGVSHFSKTWLNTVWVFSHWKPNDSKFIFWSVGGARHPSQHFSIFSIGSPTSLPLSAHAKEIRKLFRSEDFLWIQTRTAFTDIVFDLN